MNTTKFSTEDKIAALNLMASLVEAVGPSDFEDAEQVRLYEMAAAFADSMAQEFAIERDIRDLVKRSVAGDPSWKSNMSTLKALARKQVRECYSK